MPKGLGENPQALWQLPEDLGSFPGPLAGARGLGELPRPFGSCQRAWGASPGPLAAANGPRKAYRKGNGKLLKMGRGLKRAYGK